jgi:hypothetical protein
MPIWSHPSLSGSVMEVQHGGMKMVIAKRWNSEYWYSAVHQFKN